MKWNRKFLCTCQKQHVWWSKTFQTVLLFNLYRKNSWYLKNIYIYIYIPCNFFSLLQSNYCSILINNQNRRILIGITFWQILLPILILSILETHQPWLGIFCVPSRYFKQPTTVFQVAWINYASETNKNNSHISSMI